MTTDKVCILFITIDKVCTLNSVFFSDFIFVLLWSTSYNTLSADEEECGKTVSLVIKPRSIPKFELSQASLIPRREYQKSQIDLVDKEKPLNQGSPNYGPRAKSGP